MNCQKCGEGMTPSGIEMVCIECEYTKPTPPHIRWVLNEQKRSKCDVFLVPIILGIYGVCMSIIISLAFFKISY